MSARMISPGRLNTLLETGDRLTLLDVRRREDLERSRHVLPGAAWRDPEGVAGWLADMPRDRSVVIYCARGGSVSNSVVDQLRAAGIDAAFIEGGLEAWQAGGYPVQVKRAAD